MQEMVHLHKPDLHARCYFLSKRVFSKSSSISLCESVVKKGMSYKHTSVSLMCVLCVYVYACSVRSHLCIKKAYFEAQVCPAFLLFNQS